MGKHYDNKLEILKKMKEAKRLEKMSYEAPVAGMLIVFNWVLYETEKFTQGKLEKFNLKFEEYNNKYIWDDDSVFEELRKELWDKAGFKIEYTEFSEKDYGVTRNKFDKEITKKLCDSNNTINRTSTRYLLIYYEVLMKEFGYGNKRLNRVCDATSKRLATFENGKNSVLDLRKQLLDEIGVYVCLPNEKVVQDIGENEYQE